MENEFEIRMDFTIDDFYAYWKAFVKKKGGRIPPKMMTRAEAKRNSIAALVLGLLGFAGVFWLHHELGPIAGTHIYVLLCTLLVLAGAWSAYRNRGSADQPVYPYWVQGSYRKFQKIGERDLFIISEKGFDAHGPGVDHHYDLSAVKNLWADESHFYVDLGKNAYYMLPHHNFTRGDPEALPAFWIAQTGRPVLPVSPEGKELEAFVQSHIQK